MLSIDLLDSQTLSLILSSLFFCNITFIALFLKEVIWKYVKSNYLLAFIIYSFNLFFFLRISWINYDWWLTWDTRIQVLASKSHESVLDSLFYFTQPKVSKLTPTVYFGLILTLYCIMLFTIQYSSKYSTVDPISVSGIVRYFFVDSLVEVSSLLLIDRYQLTLNPTCYALIKSTLSYFAIRKISTVFLFSGDISKGSILNRILFSLIPFFLLVIGLVFINVSSWSFTINSTIQQLLTALSISHLVYNILSLNIYISEERTPLHTTNSAPVTSTTKPSNHNRKKFKRPLL